MAVKDPRGPNEIRLHEEHISHIGSTDFPNHYFESDAEEAAWDLDAFKEKAKVSIKNLSSSDIQLDLIGIDASIANAIRRVLMAEIPTMAIEKVYIYLNTSIVQDEILCQRFGLIPISVDPNFFQWKGPTGEPNDANTLVFNINVKCTRRAGVSPGETDPTILYNHSEVFSSDLVWVPQGVQARDLVDPPKPVVDDILLAKMRPGQEISAELFCEKGTARDHAKWSPVATASYRLLPTIHITDHIPTEDADDFAACFTPGVVEVVENPDDAMERIVRVVNPRIDTASREVLRHAKFKDKVVLGRQRDHFIFSIESAGQIAPEALLPEAFNVLQQKIQVLQQAADALKV